MQQFDHQHIIKLLGICSDSPIWIVMEWARHGELRAYLQNNAAHLRLGTLLSFAHQGREKSMRADGEKQLFTDMEN